MAFTALRPCDGRQSPGLCVYPRPAQVFIGRNGMSFPANILVRPGSALRLADLDPRDPLHFTDKEAAKAATKETAARINQVQDALFAENKRSLLIVLQGMDTSGKDGTV